MRRVRLPRIKEQRKLKRRNRLKYLISILLVWVLGLTGLLFYVKRRYPATAEQTASSTPTHTATATRLSVTVPPSRTPIPTPLWQVTPTPPHTPTAMRSPVTPMPSPTLTPTTIPAPTNTPSPSPPPTAEPFPYTVEGPFYRPNLVANYAGCNWLGLAGEVFSPNGEPQTGLIIHVWGGGIDELVYSGCAPAYGPSGWERSLDNHPKEGIFFVRLHDGTRPLSPVVQVRTSDDCKRNLIIINFHQRS